MPTASTSSCDQVTLSETDRSRLYTCIHTGHRSARVRTHAQVVLKLGKGWSLAQRSRHRPLSRTNGRRARVAFLKDPLFLASSVFVKKPTRIMAIAFLMVLCLLVYKLAEVRVHQRLAATGQTVADQVRKPTARPTTCWLFQCFEGIDLYHTLRPDGTRGTEVLRLTDLHRLVLRLLGPAYENSYLLFQQSAE
jgi:hypothetical protein